MKLRIPYIKPNDGAKTLEFGIIIQSVQEVDIPEIAQDQNVVVAQTVDGSLGFVAGSAIVANVPGGLHTGIFIGEVFVESSTVIRIKFGNNTTNPVGPFANTPILFTQIQ